VPSVYGGGIPVATSLEAGIEGLRRLIDNCAACGAANLLMGGIGNQDLYDRYYKAIAETCAYAAEKGVGISVKPHGGLNATGYVHPKNVAVTPGDGQVDFPAVMKQLKAGGFTSGALVIECLKPGNEKHLLAEARRARRFVEELVGQEAR